MPGEMPALLVLMRKVSTGRLQPADVWRLWADNVSAATTTGDHLMAEDRPNEVLDALVNFLPKTR
jgi:haloacetate dehalogenase